jgi:hypothetical protein
MKKTIFFTTIFAFNIICSIAQTVTDIDGNIYNTVSIGSQTWMKENLRTTRYNDGNYIPNVTLNNEWSSLKTPGYCWNVNDSIKYSTFGALYNWYAINTDNLCPVGWKVPSESDFKILSGNHFYIPDVAVKIFPSMNWRYSRNRDGSFVDYNMIALWWTSINVNDSIAKFSQVAYEFHGRDYFYFFIINSDYKENGLLVRCVKDGGISINNSVFSNSIIVYPNPAKDLLFFKNINIITSYVSIYDIIGKQLVGVYSNVNPIQISNLKKGLYIVKVIDSEKIYYIKILKE